MILTFYFIFYALLSTISLVQGFRIAFPREGGDAKLQWISPEDAPRHCKAIDNPTELIESVRLRTLTSEGDGQPPLAIGLYIGGRGCSNMDLTFILRYHSINDAEQIFDMSTLKLAEKEYVDAQRKHGRINSGQITQSLDLRFTHWSELDPDHTKEIWNTVIERGLPLSTDVDDGDIAWESSDGGWLHLADEIGVYLANPSYTAEQRGRDRYDVLSVVGLGDGDTYSLLDLLREPDSGLGVVTERDVSPDPSKDITVLDGVEMDPVHRFDWQYVDQRTPPVWQASNYMFSDTSTEELGTTPGTHLESPAISQDLQQTRFTPNFAAFGEHVDCIMPAVIESTGSDPYQAFEGFLRTSESLDYDGRP